MNIKANGWSRFSLCTTRKSWLHLCLIMMAGVAAYYNSLHVPFVLDDNYSIGFYGSSRVSDILLHGSARRVVEVTFALNHQISRMNVFGYHLVNLTIHLATAIALYFFLRSCIQALRLPIKPGAHGSEESSFENTYIPLASALLFVCHPVQIQAVTYIIQRFTTLAAFFYIASALAFIRARIAFETQETSWKVWMPATLSLLAAVMAIGSKQIAYTLPLMLVMLECCLFRGRFINRRFFFFLGSLLLLAAAFILFRWFNNTLDDLLFDLRHATSEDYYFSRVTYLLTQARVVVTYLRLLFFPINQTLIYDYPLYTSFFSAPVLASIAVHGSLIMTACICVRQSAQQDGVADKQRSVLPGLAAVGIFWFYIALAIESSIIPIRDVIFEHRVYLPSCGFFVTIVATAAFAAHGRMGRKLAAWSILTICCLVLAGMTIRRNQIWNDALTLWQDTARKSPNKGIVLANLASEYLQRNMPDKALPLFSRAIEQNMNLDFRAKTGLGLSLQALNVHRSRFTTGQEYILPGGTLNGGMLDFGNLTKWDSVVMNNQGLAFEYLGEDEKAWKAYQDAVGINPAYDLAWYNLGLLAARRGAKGQVTEAVRQLKILNPPLAKALDNVSPA